MKKILVTGATGAQGGSVVQHLLKRKNQYQIKCLTRNPDSDSAKQLKNQGVEVVKGDLSDKQSLIDAMKDCQYVFGVTNFWEHFETELKHGYNLIDAVAASPIEHFVLSTLPSADRLSGGTLSVPHFETKAKMEDYCRTKTRINYTFVHPAFYFENFLYFLPPQKKEDNTFEFGFPQGNTPLAGIAIEDLGGIVCPIFDNTKAYVGKIVGAVSEDLTGKQYADKMSEVLGVNVNYIDIPRDVFASLGFPGAEDLANMFEMNKLYILNRREDIKFSHDVYPEIKSFSQWLSENKDKLLQIITK